ncbi:hypothetical protein BV20DRAFT_961167 [Pilatotrama ljubarskyi]|nr:hypothetical protein BV20DRAFT_961167 [Pilatotrama ljubarskyi]
MRELNGAHPRAEHVLVQRVGGSAAASSQHGTGQGCGHSGPSHTWRSCEPTLAHPRDSNVHVRQECVDSERHHEALMGRITEVVCDVLRDCLDLLRPEAAL